MNGLIRGFDVIVAYTKNRGIGRGNSLPWPHNVTDMKYFKKRTVKTMNPNRKNMVIMGRKTFESIGHPLPGRENVVLSRSIKSIPGMPEVKVSSSLTDALLYRHSPEIENAFVIGGGQIYKQALQNVYLNTVIATEFTNKFECDTFFPKLPPTYGISKVLHTEKDMRIVEYNDMRAAISAEYDYLELMQDVIENGTKEESRSGNVYSTFTRQLNYPINIIGDYHSDLTQNIYRFPIVTTKRLYFRRVFEELMWMLRGQTDATILSEQGNHIWDGNTSREALDRNGLYDYNEGELGPGYGAQMIHWGGYQDIINGNLNLSGGINQVKYVIDTLKDNPYSRRAMINLWNPTDLKKMALPPCHTSYYFWIDHVDPNHPKLCGNVVLRSNDLFLGNPFNQVFTQLLTTFIAHSLDIVPGQVGMTMMIPHVYENHLDQVKIQLDRVPLIYPTLRVKKSIKSYEDMIQLELDDLEMCN